MRILPSLPWATIAALEPPYDARQLPRTVPQLVVEWTWCSDTDMGCDVVDETKRRKGGEKLGKRHR